ncbi:MAG: terpene synthase family protein [Cyanobacteria bacterium P01_B01_bin.77]
MVVTIPLNAIRVDYPRWISPHGDLMVQQLGDFTQKFQLYQSLNLSQDLILPVHSQINDYMFPRASAERMYPTGLAMIYFTLMDYIYDNYQGTNSAREIPSIYQNLVHNLISLLKGQQVNSPNNFEQAVSSMLEEFSNVDPDWHAVFMQRLREYLDAVITSRSLALDAANLSLEIYWEVRSIDTGGVWSASLIEYAHDCYLTPSQRSLEKVKLATSDMTRLCGTINDLFSYPREIANEEHPFNAVHILMMNEDQSLEEACYQLIEHFHMYLERFMRTTDAIEAEGNLSLSSYVQGLREFVSGMWHWHQEALRFRHPNSLFEEMRDQLHASSC